jgi:hypothetical protein
MFYKHKKAASVVVFQPAMSPVGTKRTSSNVCSSVANGCKPDVTRAVQFGRE